MVSLGRSYFSGSFTTPMWIMSTRVVATRNPWPSITPLPVIPMFSWSSAKIRAVQLKFLS